MNLASTKTDLMQALSSPDAFLTVLSLIEDAACIVDASNTISLVNDQMAELFGASRKDLEGIDAAVFFLAPDGTPLKEHEKAVPEDRESHERSGRHLMSGKRLTFFARSSRLGESQYSLVVIKPKEKHVDDSRLFPLTPKASHEVVQQLETEGNLDLDESENLSQLLSETSGKEHKRGEEIQIASEALWIKLHEGGAVPTRAEYQEAIYELADVIHARVVEVHLHKNALLSEACLDKNTCAVFPFTYHELADETTFGAVRVITPQMNAELKQWMDVQTPPLTGFLVLMSQNTRQEAYDFLVVRERDTFGPFDELQIIFFKRFVQNIYRDERALNQQTQDTYISQTLQLGMGNRLHDCEGIKTSALYNSATQSAQIGGDFYTVMRLAPHKACIILGDVTGKGVAAASVSSAIKTALVAYAWEGQTPSYIARALNEFFMGFSRLETFATVFIGILDTETGALSYCSAGHLPALLYRAHTKCVESLDVQSGVVGAFSDMIYEDGRVVLEPGDKLLLYTDGVTEAREEDGDFFGEDELRAVFLEASQKPIEGVCDHILEHILDFTGSKLEDDIALLALELEEQTQEG